MFTLYGIVFHANTKGYPVSQLSNMWPSTLEIDAAQRRLAPLQKSRQKHHFYVCTEAVSGGGSRGGTPASLIIFIPNLGPRGWIKIFLRPVWGSPLISGSGWPHPPLSEGLDLPPLSGMVSVLAQKLFGLVRSWPGSLLCCAIFVLLSLCSKRW